MNAEIEILRKEIARLEHLVYVPGLWRCTVCAFNLMSVDMDATTGRARATEENPGVCPNCNTLSMARVSERAAGNELAARVEKSPDQVARDCLLAIEAATCTDGLYPNRVLHAAARQGLGRESIRVVEKGGLIRS